MEGGSAEGRGRAGRQIQNSEGGNQATGDFSLVGTELLLNK